VLTATAGQPQGVAPTKNCERLLNCSGAVDEGCNAAPVIAQGTSVSVTMSEDGSPTAWSPPTISATDANSGDTLTWSKDSGPSHGTATVSGSGSPPCSPTVLSYSPIANYYGSDSFIVKVSDGIATDTITVNVTITAVNDAGPVITESETVSVTMSEDGSPIAFSLTLNATDFDNDTLTWDIPYPAGNGTAAAGGTGTSKAVTYTPALNYNGSDSFIVAVSDGSLADTRTVSVTVNAVNDAPVITAQNTLSTNEDTSLTLALEDLTVSDVDNTYPDDFSLTVSGGSNYTVSGNTITPAADFNGTLTVPVKVNDGALDSVDFNLTVTVNAVNDAPSFTASDPPAVDEDSGPQTVNGWASGFNPGPSDESGQSLVSYTVSNVSDSTFFSAGPSVDNSGNLTYTPAANANGTPTFDLTVKDSGTTANSGIDTSAVRTFAITVNAIDDAPVITGQNALSLYEDAALTIVLGNLTISDVDGTYPAGFSLTVQSGAGYTVSGNTISPPANFNGTLTVPVKVNDGGLDSNIYNLTVTVNAVNDAPAITGQAYLSTNEDTPITITLGNLTVSDVDSGGFSLTVQSAGNYTVSGSTITPSANFNGTLTVPVSVNDGSSNSNVFYLAVTVNALNDAPAITGQTALSTNEDTPITITLGNMTISDVDSSSFSLTVQSAGNYTVSGSTITPSANFNGALTVPVKVNDGGLDSNVFNLSVKVNPVDDPPVWISEIADVKVTDGDPDTVIALAGKVRDVDNDETKISIFAESGNLSLVSPSVTGNLLTLKYGKDLAGETTVTVTALSGGKTVSDIFSVTVAPLRYSVSGNVSYFGNLLPIPGMTVMLRGTDFYTGNAVSADILTDESGNYLFSDTIRGDYNLTPFKKEPLDPKKLSATDSEVIADAAAGLKILTPMQQKIADVTLNGRVSGLDASRLGRFTAGLITEMSGSGDPAPAWISEPESLSFSLNADTGNQNFTTALTGDVSGNYSPGASEKSVREPSGIKDITAAKGSVLCVPVVINDDKEILGIDIDIEYDETVISAREATLEGGILGYRDYETAVNLNEPGRIRMAIFRYSGRSFTTSGTVVNLYFDVIGPVYGSGMLTFNRFDCNEIPVSDRHEEERDGALTGGFSLTYDVSTSLRVGITPGPDYDPMRYDMNGSGKVDMRDAVRALQEGRLEGAIRALQILTLR